MIKAITQLSIILGYVFIMVFASSANAQDDPKTDREHSATDSGKLDENNTKKSDSSEDCVSVCMDCTDLSKGIVEINSEDDKSPDDYKKSFCVHEMASYCSKKCKGNTKCILSCIPGDNQKYCKERCKKDEGFTNLLSCFNGCVNQSRDIMNNYLPPDMCGNQCIHVMDTINNVRLDNIKITGETDNKHLIDKQTVKKEAQKHLFELNGCYNHALQKDKNISGHIVVQFIINPQGYVNNAFIKESTLKDNALENCTIHLNKSWRFTEPQNNQMTFVEYTIDFKDRYGESFKNGLSQ